MGRIGLPWWIVFCRLLGGGDVWIFLDLISRLVCLMRNGKRKTKQVYLEGLDDKFFGQSFCLFEGGFNHLLRSL